jgi:hypothetical protein
MIIIEELNKVIISSHKDMNNYRLYSNGHITELNIDGKEIYKTKNEIILANMYFCFNSIDRNDKLSYSCLKIEECWKFRKLMKETIFELYNKPILLIAKF